MSVPVVRFVTGGRDAPSGATGRPYTMVYDGDCRVCGRVVRLVERWDTQRQVEAVPATDPTVLARFPWIPPEAYAEAVQLVGPGGRTWQGAAAVEQLLRVLPHGRMAAWVFSLPLLGKALDRFYRWFARNRYRFGCGEHCPVGPARLDYGGGPG